MEIATARLLLREFVADDWRALFAYQNDPGYLQTIGRYPQTDSQAQEFMRLWLANQAETPRRKFQLAITLPESGELIGNCGVRRVTHNEWEADLGYELDIRYWERGFATEAAAAMLDFGFNELRVHRISATCNAGNTRSAHVLAKLGMQREGRVRETDYQHGRWWDSLMYGLLESEWRERQR